MPYQYRDTIVGPIGIGEREGAVVAIYLPADRPAPDLIPGETPLLIDAFRQLNAYLAGELTGFTLPIAPRGTPFQLRDWQVLMEVPYGTTTTYRELAARLGSPNASRAVGLANARNPIPFVIPCHRVLGSDGSLTGFRGGLEMKRFLLDLEAKHRPAR